jgi:hypothetical protein
MRGKLVLIHCFGSGTSLEERLEFTFQGSDLHDNEEERI